MGKRGPKAKPASEKRLTGSRRGRQGENAARDVDAGGREINDQVRDPWGGVRGEPKPPPHLTAAQKTKFRAFVKEWAKVERIATTLDAFTVANLIATEEMIAKVLEAIATAGSVTCVNDKGSEYMSPNFTAYLGLLSRHAAICKQLGLTPAARKMIEIPEPAPSKEKSKLDLFEESG